LSALNERAGDKTASRPERVLVAWGGELWATTDLYGEGTLTLTRQNAGPLSIEVSRKKLALEAAAGCLTVIDGDLDALLCEYVDMLLPLGGDAFIPLRRLIERHEAC
jgi:hypothetical protein